MTKRRFKAESVYPRMVEIRRALHRHPELAFEEERTAQIIIEELERLGISYSYSGKGGAVIGRLCGQQRPTVALRAEMDALPGAQSRTERLGGRQTRVGFQQIPCDPCRALARLVAESAGHLLDHGKGRADGWPSRWSAISPTGSSTVPRTHLVSNTCMH